MKKVFLGGTCNGSTWRDRLIPHLKIDYFNPVVDNWDESAKKKEIEERESSDFVLYTITPKMKGVYSIAEMVEDSIKHPEKTIICILQSDDRTTFSDEELDSMNMVVRLVEENGASVVYSLTSVANFLNGEQI